MGDKILNVLIVFMMVVIIGLGGMYYVKALGGGSQNVNASNVNTSGYRVNQGNTEKIGIDSNYTTNFTSEDNRPTIDTNIGNSGNNAETASTWITKSKINNKYYYKYLNNYSKIIYDSIVSNIEGLKTGNAVIEINGDFSEIWNNANGKEELDNCYNDAVNALNLDMPDLFYVNFGKMFLNIEKETRLFKTNYKLFIDSGDYPDYYADGFSSKSQVDLAINAIQEKKTEVKEEALGTNYNKAKTVHDWIVSHMTYESTNSQKSTVYGALVQGKGVCEAYARTYKCILDELGINNILVIGTGTNSRGITEDHMWNYVQLDGNWYAVDVTWDDPIIVGNGTISERAKYNYFLNGSKEFFKNHTEALSISPSGKIFSPPKLEVNNY